MQSTETQPMQLSTLLEIIKKWFNHAFSWQHFWCVCEVNRCKNIRWNRYFEITENENEWFVKAKAHAVLFDWIMMENFLMATKLTKEELIWKKILINVNVKFHVEYWCNLNINIISEKFMLWHLQQNKDNIVKDLKQLWIFTQNHSTKLHGPLYNIAIISSEWSQWLNDFITVINDKKIVYNMECFFASIHWNLAKAEVYQQLQKIYIAIKWWSNFDAVVIARWWGWSWWIQRQNDFNIAKWICHMPIPVVLAVWHTQDTSILDKIVKFPTKTPTDAGYLFVEHAKQRFSDITNVMNDITNHASRKKDSVHKQLIDLYWSIKNNYKQKIYHLATSIQYLRENIKLYNPENIQSRGYAILYDQEWKIITKEQRLNMSQWTYFSVKVFDTNVIVQKKDDTNYKIYNNIFDKIK